MVAAAATVVEGFAFTLQRVVVVPRRVVMAGTGVGGQGANTPFYQPNKT